MKIHITKEVNKGLKAIRVYYPNTCAVASQGYHAAILCTVNNKIIGFEKDKPYHPAGDSAAIESIVNNPKYDGFMLGAELFGLDCWQCYETTYRLGAKPDSNHLTAIAAGCIKS